MAQNNQSAQAVESVEKTEVAKKAANRASTLSGQNRYDFHGNEDNRNQAHDVLYGQNHSDEGDDCRPFGPYLQGSGDQVRNRQASRFAAPCSTLALLLIKTNSNSSS